MKTKTHLLAGAMIAFSLSAFGADEPGATPKSITRKGPIVFTRRGPIVVVPGQNDPKRDIFGDRYEFIFFATLEGLYRDGVSQADVEALLARKAPDAGYLNFIYTCPICMPVEGAIETYKLRPRIDHLKTFDYQATERTFGFGLTKETSEALRSEKASVRFGAVNELVSKWISYRMEHSGLNEAQKKDLIEKLKKGRDEGMQALRNFASESNGPNSLKNFAAGYASGDECAICNAALQMPLKLKPVPEK